MSIFIIAEIGINHNGSLDICKKLIDTAKSAGCDAVKFQKRTLSKVYSEEELKSLRESPFGKTFYDQKKGLEFETEQYNEIDEWDSIGHMTLIAALEENFKISFETDDIVDFSSYKKGKEILKKYKVDI